MRQNARFPLAGERHADGPYRALSRPHARAKEGVRARDRAGHAEAPERQAGIDPGGLRRRATERLAAGREPRVVLVPPHVSPRVPRPRGAALVAALVRNTPEGLPPEVYREDFFAVAAGRAPRAWVTSPALIKAVLLDQRDKFGKLTQIRLLGPLLGHGILTSEDADWKWQRQAAAPMFRPQELAAFVPAFVRAAERALARWRSRPPGAVISMDAEM